MPHFAGKFGVERMIEGMGFNATVLRPAYFMNNDLAVKYVVLGYGIYPRPIGAKGLAMIDAADLGEIAGLELIRREQAEMPLPFDRINLVGPETLTGSAIAAIWSEVLGRQIDYGGHDTAAFEQNLRQKHVPGWRAFDMRLMCERFLTVGMLAKPGDADRLTASLRGPLRSYRDFASQLAASS